MQNPKCVVMVDNCYGEFSESIEPPMVVCDGYAFLMVISDYLQHLNN